MKKWILFISLILIIMIIFLINNFCINDNKLINDDWLNKPLLDKKNEINKKIYYPSIQFISDVVSGENEFYTSVNRIFKINSLSDIDIVKICVTTSEECIPNKYYLKDDIVYNISFKDNKNDQRLCVYVKNKAGYESTTCDLKTYKVDSFIPKISVKESIIYIDNDKKYDATTNIKAKFGVSGGKIYCDKTDNLKIGENIIKCIALGNNGEKSGITFSIIMSPTYKKTAVFFGDSITYGSGSKDLKSWAYYIGKNYDLKKSYNRGENGATLAQVPKWNQLWKIVLAEKKNNYDFVILHGGCNDVAKDIPIGAFDKNDFSGNYDETTFLGGLELYLYYVTKQWSDARIGFIIPYRTPNNEARNDEKSNIYYIKMKEVLDKWSIEYIDLFDGVAPDGKTYSQILSVYDNKYMPDTLHINDDGYKIISPYIYKWMQSLPKYSDIKIVK